jgi:hypothetical protein
MALNAPHPITPTLTISSLSYLKNNNQDKGWQSDEPIFIPKTVKKGDSSLSVNIERW